MLPAPALLTLPDNAPPPDDLAASAVRLQARVLSHRRLATAATGFVTDLAASLGCVRVTLGFAPDDAIRLAAVSGGGEELFVGEAFDAIAEAMDEARQQAASVHLPADGAARSLIALAHLRLLQRHGGSIVTVPLVHDGRVIGAITCEWTAPRHDLAEVARRLETLVNLVGPVLDLMREREEPLRRRCAAGLRRGWRGLLAPERRRARAWLASGACALAGLCAVPVEYRVGGSARVEGEEQRSIVAPTDGYLRVAHVRPGDAVRRGQVLVEMSDEDLALQQRKWASELGQHESAYATALARADRPAMVVALARAEQARAQLALVEADLARLAITAPFDGVVLQGDLHQSIGAPLERGKPLMQLAPGERLRVVVSVDERDVADVQPGQRGSLALSALPWDTLELQVTRVTPIARTVDGANVFEVEAAVSAAADAHRVRPGLEGVARIAVDHRPLAWTWFHRAVDWLRLALWSWWA